MVKNSFKYIITTVEFIDTQVYCLGRRGEGGVPEMEMSPKLRVYI